MKLTYVIAASAAAIAGASTASAERVLNTDLPNVTTATASTVTNANGTVTTSTGARVTAGVALGRWHQANVGGGASVGITRDYSNDGDGAAYFASTGSAGKADLQRNFTSLVSLSKLESVSFSFFVDPASQTINGTFAPVLRLNMLKNGSFAGSLVFEYAYQGLGAAPEGQWVTQTASLNSGNWWATNAALGPVQANANGGVKSLQSWIDANGSAELQVFGVNIGIGSGWDGNFAGAIDDVRYSFAGGPSSEVNFAVVPEPATWAMMIGGFGLVGAASRRRSRKVAYA
jgi:hypothetical protein